LVKEETNTPALNLEYERLSHFFGRKIDVKEIGKKIPYIGVDLEDVKKDSLKIEYNPNRPDLGIISGIVKAFKGLTREETGLIEYTVNKGDYQLFVNEQVKNIRPYILGAIVKNFPMNEASLKELISFQEDLHLNIGRKRKKSSIGIHNFDVINFPVFYSTIGKEEKFLALNEAKEMFPEEILKYTDIGKKHAHLLKDNFRYPIIKDSKGKVLSFPPIINSELTRVDSGTNNLFIDITGTDLNSITNTCNLLLTSLADYGAEIWGITINAPDWQLQSPNLSVKELKILSSLFSKMIGIKITDEELIDSLQASRLDAKVIDKHVLVKIPAYRIDIMHPIDLVEELFIGFGSWKIKPLIPPISEAGTLNSSKNFNSKVAQVLIGGGFEEVVNFTLSSINEQFIKMNLNPEGYVDVIHSKSLEYEILRKWILPDLLEVLHVSKKESYPQKIFEIGKTINLKDNYPLEETYLSVVITYRGANYSDIKSLLDLLTDVLEITFNIVPTEHPSFIPGRIGKILIENKEAGLIGEVSPLILDKFQLETPVVYLETNLDVLEKFYIHRIKT
jgi:phenylalanyl-tRNA synthetase beta chain